MARHPINEDRCHVVRWLAELADDTTVLLRDRAVAGSAATLFAFLEDGEYGRLVKIVQARVAKQERRWQQRAGGGSNL